MTVDWLLAGDIGTTTLKLGAIAPDGRLIGLVRHEYDLDTPGPDRVELAPDVYWTFFCQGVRGLLAEAGLDPRALKAIAFSSQATTFLFRDASGRPVGPFIVWLDGRAEREAAELQAHFGARAIYPRTGQPQLFGLVQAAKLLWLRRHQPDVLRRGRRLFHAEDDLIYRLTGEHATDPVLAGASCLYDLPRQAWWPEMLDFVGLDADQLPRVVPAGRPVATLQPAVAASLGLPSGVPVVSGTNDQLAGAIAVGNLRPGVISETTGTALAVVATISGSLDPVLAAQVPFWGHPAPGRFSILVYANTATIILKWFRQQFCPDLSYDAIMAEVANVPIGSEGVTFFPHFAGTGCPDLTTEARGEIAGLALHHTKFHIARALIESLVFTLKDLVLLAASASGPPAVIRSMGGASRSDVWLQMKADVLQTPVEKPDTEDSAVVGAAMLAAVGAGLYPDLEAASAAMTRLARRFEPNPALREAYEPAYRRYRLLYERICQAARRS